MSKYTLFKKDEYTVKLGPEEVLYFTVDADQESIWISIYALKTTSGTRRQLDSMTLDNECPEDLSEAVWQHKMQMKEDGWEEL